MLAGSAARRYARALAAIGAADGTLDAMVGEVGGFAEALSASRELRNVLSNPRFALKARRAMLRELCGKLALSRTVTSGLLLLLDRGRIGIAGGVARELARLADESQGRLRAKVTAAAELPAAYFQKLQGELERLTKRRIVIETSVDPALLAGIRAQIGDLVYDGSARARLGAVRARLLQD